MPRPHSLSGQHQSCEEIAFYHSDVLASLRMMFLQGDAATLTQYVGYTHDEMLLALKGRREELERRSSFALLAALEAAFRVDFAVRCNDRRKDPLSRAFRSVSKQHASRVSLKEHILPEWRSHIHRRRSIISDIVGAFNYRHWLAHGRYWTPKFGRRFDYEYVYLLVNTAMTQLPLVR